MTQPFEIKRVTPFLDGGGSGVAAVSFRLGPVVVRAKLVKNKDDKLFLSMPARKSTRNEEWYDLITISDRELHRDVETAAILAYQSQLVSGAAT